MISYCYRTVEISVLGHFIFNSILAIKGVINFTYQVPVSKVSSRGLLIEITYVANNFCLTENFFKGKNGQSDNLDCLVI